MIYNSSGDDLVGEDLVPFVEAKVGSNDDGLDAGTGPNLSHQNRRSEAPLYTKIIDKFVRYLLHNRNNRFVFFIARIYVHLQSVKTSPFP